MAEDERLIDVEELAKLLSCSTDTVWRLARNDPAFPEPIRFSRKMTRWRLSAVLAWIDAKEEAA